jgi:glycolate oxidase
MRSGAGRISPDYYAWTHDPRKHLGRVLGRSRTWKKYSLRCMNVFHAGDGNRIR